MRHSTATTTRRGQPNNPTEPIPCRRCGKQCGLSQFRDSLKEPFRFAVFCPGCDLVGPERRKALNAIRAWNEVQR